MSKPEYLIIGGSTKCGTTSLFNYFEYHPDVCPSVMKESRYFWDNVYPLKSKKSNIFQSFQSLFNDCFQNKVKLEATPDYLYSKGSAEKIKGELNSVKFVFILREPVDRLKSWYKFAYLNGAITQGTTFENYISQQINLSLENTPQHLLALQQGKYSQYLENYIQLFGINNINIVYYEQLAKNPQILCESISKFAEIDPSYFKNFDFLVFNKSILNKSVYAHQLFRKFKRSVRPVKYIFPLSIRKKLKLAGQDFEKLFINLNSSNQPINMELSVAMNEFLNQYYAADADSLTRITGNQPPWK